MERVLELLATLAAGLFAGAALYINLVEHRARKICEPSLAVREFGASYRIGAVFMGLLLMTCFVCSTAVWLLGSSDLWLIGGGLLLSLIPYTLVFVFPINKRLMDASVEADSDLASDLLTRWGRRHTVRSFMGLTAFFLFIYLLAQSTPR